MHLRIVDQALWDAVIPPFFWEMLVFIELHATIAII